MQGEQGDDELIGNGGVDILFGGIGNDTLRGGDRFDRLKGFENRRDAHLSANDTDILVGGNDGDSFILSDNGNTPYAYGSGYAVVEDFNPSEDTIHIGTSFLGDWDCSWQYWFIVTCTLFFISFM